MKRRRPLSFRLGLPIVGVAALAIVGGMTATSILAGARLKADAEHRAADQVVALETIANVSDLAGLRRATTAIGAGRDVSLALVAAGDPLVIIASSQTSLTGIGVADLEGELLEAATAIQDPARSESVLAQREGDDLIAAGRLRVRDTTRDGADLSNAIGIVQLDLSSVVAEVSRDTLILTIGEVLAVALLAAVAIVLVRRHVVRPLHALGESVRAGDESVVDSLTSIEINELAAKLHGAMAARSESEARLADANEQLRGLVESKDQFMASVSHELRTPLASIIGFADYLKDPEIEISDDERTSFIDTISREGADVMDLIDDLLTAARADIDRLEVATVRVGLLAQARQVVEGLAGRLGEVKVIGAPVSVAGDPRRVRQVIRNLLTNADRYGGPNVTVEVRHHGGQGLLRVQDDGLGIALEDRELVFEPYMQARDGVHIPDSVGIGLPVSRTLARLMAGDLTYARIGDESVFELSLPIMEDAAPAEGPSSQTAANLELGAAATS